MTDQTRRSFLKTAAIIAAAGTVDVSALHAADNPKTERTSPKIPFSLGMASYTFRSFTLDQAIAMTQRLGLNRITLKDVHLPMQSSESEIKTALEKIHAAGMELSSCGVVYMKSEEEVRRAFEYAQMAGLKIMVGVPEVSLLPIAERYVRETDITLAVHNHGPTDKRFPSPENVYTSISGLDKRIGLCLDIGHTQRLGLDPGVEAEKYFDRLYDIHIKDVDFSEAKGKTVEIGRGVIDIPQFLKTMIRLGYNKTMHFEFEKDKTDPLPGAAESLGYVRGVLAALDQK